MLNNKVLLIAIAILVLGGGIYFFSTGNIPTTGNSLTREKAAQMIEEEIAEGGIKETTQAIKYNEAPAGYPVGYYGDTGYFGDGWIVDKEAKQLEAKGLIRITGKDRSGYPVFEFTEKAGTYFRPLSPTYAGINPKNKNVLLSTITKVEVTGLTTPTEESGQKVMKADFTMYYDLTPFGEADSSVSKEQKSRATFIMYDDGWRVDRLFR